MGKEELGTKRVDPDTGRKFYDLNKDPIISPYTGKSYPRSYFDNDVKVIEEEEEEAVAEELDTEEELEVVALEDAEEDDTGVQPGSPDIDEPDDDVIELDDDDADDTFLADDEEEEDDDVSVIIKVGKDEDDH